MSIASPGRDVELEVPGANTIRLSTEAQMVRVMFGCFSASLMASADGFGS